MQYSIFYLPIFIVILPISCVQLFIFFNLLELIVNDVLHVLPLYDLLPPFSSHAKYTSDQILLMCPDQTAPLGAEESGLI